MVRSLWQWQAHGRHGRRDQHVPAVREASAVGAQPFHLEAIEISALPQRGIHQVHSGEAAASEAPEGAAEMGACRVGAGGEHAAVHGDPEGLPVLQAGQPGHEDAQYVVDLLKQSKQEDI